MPAWQETITQLVPGAQMRRGASSPALATARSAVSRKLPRELAGLLKETNGVASADGSALIWPVAEIVSQNRVFRDPAQIDAQLYKPFDSLVLFGAAGNGDLFAYDTAASASPDPPIVRWDHETDERAFYARDLRQYLRLRAGSLPEPTGADRAARAEASAEIVSVWLGTSLSEAEFRAYLAPGGSGAVSADGLPLSRFQADFHLTFRDVARTEEHVVFSSRPTRIARLLEGVRGGHCFVVDAARKAADLGADRATSAILVYGLAYEWQSGSHLPAVTFVGSFEYE